MSRRVKIPAEFVEQARLAGIDPESRDFRQWFLEHNPPSVHLTTKDVLLAVRTVAERYGRTEVVVLGKSTAILSRPEAMLSTADVDITLVMDTDAEFNSRINRDLGKGSDFHVENGFYVESLGHWVFGDKAEDILARCKPIVIGGETVARRIDELDYAALKILSGRDKDMEFLNEALSKGVFHPRALAEFLRRHWSDRLQEMQGVLARLGVTA